MRLMSVKQNAFRPTLQTLWNSAFMGWENLFNLMLNANTAEEKITPANTTYQNAWHYTMHTYWVNEASIEKVKYCNHEAALGIIYLSIQAFLPLSKPSILFHMSTISICQLVKGNVN